MRKLAAFLALGVLAVLPLSADYLVVYVAGTAHYRTETSPAWNAISEGQRLPESCYFRTGDRSELELVNENRLRLILASNTLGKLKAGATADVNRVLVHTGEVIAKVLGTKQQFQVRSATANLGVRGTEFAFLTHPSTGTLIGVGEGKVFTMTRALDGSISGGAFIEKGQSATARPGAAPVVTELGSAGGLFEDLSALKARESGRRDPLFDRWANADQGFFREFQKSDLADYQLFVLEDLDQRWEYLLKTYDDFGRLQGSAPGKKP